ncbi:hypothetical protein BD560DRAFT_389787 [Blakeslea trispora]|nr:hypothetical protein BD560DRAFT_389787 [Blakeslea trispora]
MILWFFLCLPINYLLLLLGTYVHSFSCQIQYVSLYSFISILLNHCTCTKRLSQVNIALFKTNCVSLLQNNMCLIQSKKKMAFCDTSALEA